MDLGENYFLLLGQYLLEFVVALVLLAGLYFLTRRWISKELLARAFRWGMLSLIYVSVSAFALDAFMAKWGFRGETSPFGFERMLDHTAERPYVYRVLSGEVIKRAARLIPEHLSEERGSQIDDGFPRSGAHLIVGARIGQRAAKAMKQ